MRSDSLPSEPGNAAPPRKKPWPWIAIPILYFAVAIVPLQIYPAARASLWFLIYIVTFPFCVLALAIFGVWGMVGFMRHRKSPRLPDRYRKRLVVCAAGVTGLAIVILAAKVLPAPLPTGSDRMAFNPSVWAQDTPSSPKRNEPTARQQMLAAVVTQVIPGKSRAALEAALGPQENTDKFKGLGRDMIWKLGPQRDTFIGLDSEWLLIWLDAKGQYERHMIAND